MSTDTLVSVREYLTTDYSPDVDYVDGVLEDRNVGEKDHALVQKRLLLYLAQLERTLDIFVIQEQRVQVSATCYRVPDTCVIAGGEPAEQILTAAPFLCIEVLSPEDRMTRIMRKVDDYLNMGVRYTWIIDPTARKAFIRTLSGTTEVKDGVLRTTDPGISVPLAELFD